MEILWPYLKVFVISLVRYFVLAGIPFIIFYKLVIEKLIKSKIQERNASFKDFKREVMQSVQSTIVIGFVAILFTKTELVNYTTIYTDIQAHSYLWFAASVVIALVIHDTYFYWMHRLLHHKKLYRLTHKVHHLSVNPSPWASYSFHFTEAFTEALIIPIVIFTLPIHPLALLLFATASFFINVYGHLGFEIAPLWLRKTFFFEVLNTSVHHNMHHSKFKGNYGLYFRVWDRLMGTENPDYVRAYDEIQARRLKNILAKKREQLSSL